MKATLTFTLPDEQHEYEDAVNGGKWKLVVEQLEENLREWDKYGHNFKSVEHALGDVRKSLHDALAEWGLRLHE